MRRLIITLTIVAGLFVPAVAVASRIATGNTKKAIDRALTAELGGIPGRCLVVRVTTKDGGNWANVSSNLAAAHSVLCAKHVFNGFDIVRRTHAHWHYVTGGSVAINCAHFGIPVAVRKDLRLDCAVTPPTGSSMACGTVNINALHVDFQVYRVSCATSLRILGAYLHGEGVGEKIQPVKGFPGWTCSTGDNPGGNGKRGVCSKGKTIGVPLIVFFFA